MKSKLAHGNPTQAHQCLSTALIIRGLTTSWSFLFLLVTASALFHLHSNICSPPQSITRSHVFSPTLPSCISIHPLQFRTLVTLQRSQKASLGHVNINPCNSVALNWIIHVCKTFKGDQNSIQTQFWWLFRRKKNKQTNNQEPLKSFQSVTIFFANVKHPATSNYLL